MLFLEQFPIIYDPKARPVEFLRVFKEIVTDPNTRFEILRSWAVCFDKRPLKRETELWIGPPDSGKTTLLNVLRVLLGQKNYSSMTLYQLTDSDDRFSSSHLAGKAANIFDDLTTIELKELGQYKAITGGGTIPAQFKGKKHFDFAPYLKFFFACNSPPVLLDQTILDDLAFFERFKLRFFTETFRGSAKDESLTDLVNPEEAKLTKSIEISGLFNFLIGILRSVRKYQDYGYALDGHATKELWMSAQASGDIVTRFLNTRVVVKDDSFIPVTELWEAWEVWRKNHIMQPLSRTEFNKRVEKLAYQSNNHKVRVWSGIDFKDGHQTELLVTEVKNNQRGLNVNGVNPFSFSNHETKRYRRGVCGEESVNSVLSNDNGLLKHWFSNPLRLVLPYCSRHDKRFATTEAYRAHLAAIMHGEEQVSRNLSNQEAQKNNA